MFRQYTVRNSIAYSRWALTFTRTYILYMCVVCVVGFFLLFVFCSFFSFLLFLLFFFISLDGIRCASCTALIRPSHWQNSRLETNNSNISRRRTSLDTFYAVRELCAFVCQKMKKELNRKEGKGGALSSSKEGEIVYLQWWCTHGAPE